VARAVEVLEEAGLHFGAALVSEVLRLAGESPRNPP
jgi:hypothetical protein